VHEHCNIGVRLSDVVSQLTLTAWQNSDKHPDKTRRLIIEEHNLLVQCFKASMDRGLHAWRQTLRPCFYLLVDLRIMQVLICELVCLGCLHKVQTLLSFIKPKVNQIASYNLKHLHGRGLLFFLFVSSFNDLDVLSVWGFAFFRFRDFSLLIWSSAIEDSSLSRSSIVAFNHLHNLC